MTNYTKNSLVAALRIKLIEVFYVSWIWKWCSMLLCQADAFGPVNLCHLERTLPASGWGELVHAFSGKYASKYQIVHLELHTMHKPLVIALEHLAVRCILESYFPSCFIDQVDIITSELIRRDFVVHLNTGGGGGGGGRNPGYL
jgi:hypothetical protein